ncbi:MAG: hypothetical protein CFE21_13155 [Bacteroidetes bacterium B1(2017)]|nr:MAG: hypothetical protein CFE21_13155 [Bacteroidetes bacterium B1(2017)]
MKNSKSAIFIVLILLFSCKLIWAQGNSYHPISLPIKEKGKPVIYNAFGMGVLPYQNLMIGGNHISYRKIGFGVSWRMGIENFNNTRKGFSGVDYDTASNKGWFTRKSKNYYSFAGTFNVVVPITQKIPFYLGVGVVRQRNFREIQTPFAQPGETEWVFNPYDTKFKFNFTAGVFIPIVNQVVLNIAYDHLPQTIFVGIAISGPFNYEDLDMWE